MQSQQASQAFSLFMNKCTEILNKPACPPAPTLSNQEKQSYVMDETVMSFDEAAHVLHCNRHISTMEDYILYTLEKSIKDSIEPAFLTRDESIDFPQLLHQIYIHCHMVRTALVPCVQALSKSPMCSLTSDSCISVYRTSLEIPYYKRIKSSLEDFYTQAYGIIVEPDEESEDTDGCNKCQQELCACSRILQQISQVSDQLSELNLFHSITEEVIFSIVKTKIQEHVETTCNGSYDVRHLSDLKDWLTSNILTWIDKVAGFLKSSMLLSKDNLLQLLHSSFVKSRLGEMLPLIIDFPDSKPGFEDLHDCLPQTDLRKQLIAAIKQVFENRILHPGVTTTDILTAYIQSIQALRVLDPSCVILEVVTEPVKQYLRSREDTVRCIVSNLIDDSCDVLSDELTKGTTDHDILDDDIIDEDWRNWQPDPVDANPAISSKTRRSTDIINMLVNIYGTKELFIKEYWNLLADRLLSNLTYSTLWEIKYFELLKIRFGEADLHKCEVMLKDVTDSKRLNSRINDELSKSEENPIPFQMNALILSAQYWPSFREEKVKLPDELKAALDKYTSTYEVIKGNRTLQWEPHLGQVEIDIELDSNKTVTYKASPVNVAVIMAFQEQDTYNVEELGEKLQMSTSVVRRCASFWQTRGLLREEAPDRYRLNQEEEEAFNYSSRDQMEDEEEESAIASAEQQKEEQLQMLWTYINGMLTNMSAQPLARIHSLLKMFANTDISIQDLEKFLGQKIREESATEPTSYSSQQAISKSPSLSETSARARTNSSSAAGSCQIKQSRYRKLDYLSLAASPRASNTAKPEMALGFQDKHRLIGQVEEYNKRISLPTFHIKGNFTSDDDVEYEGALRFFLAHADNNFTKAVRLTSSTTWKVLKPVLLEKFNLTEGVEAGKLVPILYVLKDETGDECSVQDEDRPLVLALQECGNLRFVLKVYQKGTDSTTPTLEQKSKMNQSNKFFAAMKKKLNKSKSKDQLTNSPMIPTSPKNGVTATLSRDPISPMAHKGKHARQKSDNDDASIGSRKKSDASRKSASKNLANSAAANARSMENLSKAGKTVKKKQKAKTRTGNSMSNMLAIDDTEEFVTVHGDRNDLGVDEVVIPIDGGMTVRDIITDVLDECEISLAKVDDYALWDVIGREMEGLWLTDYSREMNDSEKPLLLISMMKPSEGLSRRFEVKNTQKEEEADAHTNSGIDDHISFEKKTIQRQASASISSSISNVTDYNSQTLKFPTDVPYFLTIQSFDSQKDAVLHLVNRTTSIIGRSEDEDECSMRLFAPDILPQHCWVCKVYENEDDQDYKCVSLAPFPGALVKINDEEISKKTNIQAGDVISLGKQYIFLFKDPKHPKSLPTDGKALHSAIEAEKQLPLFSSDRRWHDVVNGVMTLTFTVDKQNELLSKIFSIMSAADEGYKLTPAYLMALALDHAKHVMNGDEYGNFLTQMCTDFQQTVWESSKALQSDSRDPDSSDPVESLNRVISYINPLFLWLANCVELRAYVSATVAPAIQNFTTTEILDDALNLLSDTITYAFQQTVYHLTKVLYPTLDLILTDNPFSRTPSNSISMQNTLDCLSTILTQASQMSLGADVSLQLISYLYFFVGTSLCNKMFELESATLFYNWEEGVKIRKNLELLECWAVDSGLEPANNYLRKVICVADFLATSKQFLMQASWHQLRNLYPLLGAAQLRHLLDNYDLGNRNVPPQWCPPSEEVYSIMEEGVMESFEDHPPLVIPSHSCINLSERVVDKVFHQHLDYINSLFSQNSEDETDSGFDLGHSRSPTEVEDHGKSFGERIKRGSRSSNNSETGSKSYTPIFKKKKDSLPQRRPVEKVALEATLGDSSDDNELPAALQHMTLTQGITQNGVSC